MSSSQNVIPCRMFEISNDTSYSLNIAHVGHSQQPIVKKYIYYVAKYMAKNGYDKQLRKS